MLNAADLISNALTARDHADRANRIPQISSLSPLMKRRADALEKAATRMELEAKAALLSRWRGQARPATWEPHAARAVEVAYVERRRALPQARVVPDHMLSALLGLSLQREPAFDRAVLASLRPRLGGMPMSPASGP